MSNTHIDFYFDFGSPTAYLAYKRFMQLKERYDFTLNMTPVLLGGIFKASDNQSPVANAAKGAYMSTHDLPRFARRYNVPLAFNPYFPINTLSLMRAAYAAIEEDCFYEYVDTVFSAFWEKEANMGDMDVIASTLSEAGLNADTLLTKSQTPEIKQLLIAATDAVVQRGAFGLPTIFIGDEMFFGQDRMDFIEERLAQ